MNLYYLAQRRDRALILSEGVSLHRQRVGGESYRGLILEPGSRIVLRDFMRFFPFYERPSHCDWYVVAEKAGRAQQHVSVSLKDADATNMVSQRVQEVGGCARPLLLPWPLMRTPLAPKLDLVVEALHTNTCPVFLAVHLVLSREGVLSAATGVGVEIGPGANPQLRSDQQRQVFYLEQMPPDEWERLYGKEGGNTIDRSLWQQYKIGQAHELPFADSSLDFIFHCHVFEHLSNPLGHLEHWRKKLRSRGVILGIVPDLAGAKDAMHQPCDFNELLSEYQNETWVPSEEHYRRYVSRFKNAVDPLDWMRQRRSIHVHFYTNRNMSELLSFACSKLGYQGFHIQHTPNHKDFHFVLIAS